MNKKTIMCWAGLALILGICDIVQGAINCSNAKTYPYRTNEGLDNTNGTDYTPASVENVLSGIAGWFGVGAIGSITSSEYLESWVVCCDGIEKKWEASWTSYISSASVTPSIGTSASDFISNLAGAINGYGYDSETWETISGVVSALDITAVSASFSYSANFDAPDTKIDECACGEEALTADFFGGETYKITAAGPEYDSAVLSFSILSGECKYKKQGWQFATSWSSFYTENSSIVSSYKIGIQGDVRTFEHIHEYDSGNLGSGAWCSTTLDDYR